MRGTWLILTVLTISANVTRADWWYTYEGDGTFPEEQGWERNIMGGGAQRWFEDGAFVLDSTGSTEVLDIYAKGIPSLPDPNDPTHAFVCEWRLRVDTIAGFWNPTLFLRFQGYGGISLAYDMDQIMSLEEGEYITGFEAGVFHSYRLVTSDMGVYTLAIDGVVVYTGEVSPWAPSSWVQFGDSATTRGSLSRWDYIRYGVTTVPEPGSILLCVAAVVLLRNRSRRRTR